MIIPPIPGLLFPAQERGLLTEAHGSITRSYHTLSSRESPEWSHTMTLYEVFLRCHSHEGTLENLLRDLPRLEELGVKSIWLMPIHPTGKKGRKGCCGSPYSVQDYFALHPDLGSGNDLRHLVESVHALDMRILIDLVANHAANDHVEMKNHPDWFRRDRQGRFTRKVRDWSDVTDLDYGNRELRAYMKRAILHWVREFDIDGYRCDVAGLVPLDFWVEVRDELDRVKPEVFLLAEGDHPEMHLHAFDATYDWDLYYTLEDIRKGKAPAEAVIDVVLRAAKLLPKEALRLRFLENHDLPRSMRLLGDPAYKPYAALIFTIPGIPLIYAGQEIGVTRRSDILKKEPIDWKRENSEAVSFYKKLIRLRQQHSLFCDGELIKVNTDSPERLVAFARVKEKTVAVVVLNFSGYRVESRLFFPEQLREGRSQVTFNRDGKGEHRLLAKDCCEISVEPHDFTLLLSQ